MTVFRNRRNTLLEATGAEAYLVVDLARLMPKEIDHTSLFYLTGYTGEGVLLITADEAILLADERYFEAAKAEVGHDLTVQPATGVYLANIKAEVERLGISELSFTSNRITYSLFDRLRELLDLKLAPMDDPILRLRQCKDDDEVTRIKAAIDISETCLEQLIDKIEVGMTEREIAARLDILMLENGAERAFEPIVATGENSYNQHHVPSERAIKAGEFLLIDFGAKKDEYLADITRTFAVKTITPKMRAMHDAARRATEIGNNNLGPGKPIKEVWQAIRDHLDQTEFATDGEVSGHCIGLDLHERPFILPDETDEMKPGMVTTMEPGIYVIGYGGVRIEDDVLITADGAEVLTGFTRDLLVVG